MKTSRLTAETRMRILASVADTEATGLGIPNAATNKSPTLCEAAFLSSGTSLNGGPDGAAARLAGAAPEFQLRSVCHPAWNRDGGIKNHLRSTTMNTIPSVFNFNSAAVRTVVIDNEPWFSAADVCAVLGMKNHREATRHLDDDEKGVISNDTPGGAQQISIINESGLYSLVLRSRKPEAKPFIKWVTKEVLPAIRKTGQYIAQPYVQNPGDKLTKEQADTLRQLLTEAVKKLPKEKQAGAMIQGWSKLKAHFKVGYRDIPQSEFTEAISVIARHVIAGEYLPAAVNTEKAPKKVAPAVISDYLQIHINRKTHEIAIGQYEAIRLIITEAVQSNLNCGAAETEAHDLIESYGDSASNVMVMNNRDVFMLASQTTQLLNTAGQALETIHRLEKHLGRNLYQRKQHGERGHFGLPESLVESVLNAVQEREAA